MSAKTTDQAQQQRNGRACYVYGLVRSDTKLDRDAAGVGDPPAEVGLVKHGDVAALVSEVDLNGQLGRPEDLLAHEQLLDSIAADAPVLPLRFGAVMTTPDDVVEELLAPHEDEFADALDEVEGRAEYMIRGRFVEDAVLREILAESSQAQRLRDGIRDKPEAATRDLRIQLGELINQTMAVMREQATQQLAETLRPVTVMIALREPSHELDAANLAVLVDMSCEGEFEDAVQEVARQWEGRIGLRLLGPLAPYDFVISPQV